MKKPLKKTAASNRATRKPVLKSAAKSSLSSPSSLSPSPSHKSNAHTKSAAKAHAARCAVLTVSDSRSVKTDSGGALAVKLLTSAGHRVTDRNILPDDIEKIWGRVAALANSGLYDLILLTGGTGLSARDVTPEAVRPLFDKELPGFGELFRQLSYRDIGAAAFFSRAMAGIVKRSLVVCLPGSPAAVELALRELVLSELGHLIFELGKHGSAVGISLPQ